jgi:hypothetical protein
MRLPPTRCFLKVERYVGLLANVVHSAALHVFLLLLLLLGMRRQAQCSALG